MALMELIYVIVKNTQICVKINTKLTILRLNHELIHIMVNKGWIHRDLGQFLGIQEIQSNRMKKLVEKLGI